MEGILGKLLFPSLFSCHPSLPHLALLFVHPSYPYMLTLPALISLPQVNKLVQIYLTSQQLLDLFKEEYMPFALTSTKNIDIYIMAYMFFTFILSLF